MWERLSSCTRGWQSWDMRWHKAMLPGYLTSMGRKVCAWENLDFVQMRRGISLHTLCGGKLLSKGTERDYDRAVEAYMHAKSQSNAQAMFNLGYMHEHGQGLSFDLHLAKRYYDQAVELDSAAKLLVTLALGSLWIRKNYADSFLFRQASLQEPVMETSLLWGKDQ